MKSLLKIIWVGLFVCAAGCKTANGPQLLQTGVGLTAGYALYKHPEAAPVVRAGKDVICAAAHGTNVSPASIVAALDATGNWTPEAWFILQGALSLYSLSFNLLANTNTETARPYAQALCYGLEFALTSPLPPSGERAIKAPPKNAVWPQMR